MQDFPSAGPDLLGSMVSAHSQGASTELRSGIALALSSSAPQWQSKDATAALDFLLARGFAEEDDEVRSAMADAGACYCHKLHVSWKKMSSMSLYYRRR